MNIHAAKTHLSRLIEKACAGEEVIIARDSEPMVRLVPVKQPGARREFGVLKGKIQIPEALFDPLPGDELDAWEK
ncbi:MAG TPA: type II toxin-antitoxin system prevent-host-death family antitoxin [Longimicrobium sp.]|nr:type II toxin-antitoxin system prevent-host-death family antitoxin [Longimicrobium sp.]